MKQYYEREREEPPASHLRSPGPCQCWSLKVSLLKYWAAERMNENSHLPEVTNLLHNLGMHVAETGDIFVGVHC